MKILSLPLYPGYLLESSNFCRMCCFHPHASTKNKNSSQWYKHLLNINLTIHHQARGSALHLSNSFCESKVDSDKSSLSIIKIILEFLWCSTQMEMTQGSWACLTPLLSMSLHVLPGLCSPVEKGGVRGTACWCMDGGFHGEPFLPPPFEKRRIHYGSASWSSSQLCFLTWNKNHERIYQEIKNMYTCWIWINVEIIYTCGFL